jgi:hypothetical protein
VNLIYVVLVAMAFAVGVVAGFIKSHFFEPASVHCPVGSTDKRCVRARKIAERSATMTPEQARQASESR